jgi:signal recognition particle subunit SRP68
VYLILLTAERAWTHAMLMKSSHAEDSASQKFPGSTRSHIVSRLVKAAKHAYALVDIFRETSKGSTNYLETLAYASYLLGLAEFEKHLASPREADVNIQREKWKQCLEELSIARVIYAALLKSSRQEGFKEILSTSIDPSIRYAAYQSQIPRSVAVSDVARQSFPVENEELVTAIESLDSSAFNEQSKSATGDGGLPKSVTWRSRKADIVDAAIGEALVAVSDAEKRLAATNHSAGSEAQAYDEVLIACQDAIDATRHALEEYERERVAESDPRMQNLRVTNLAVNYNMIGWRVGRNRALIGSKDGLSFKLGSTQAGKYKKPSGKGQRLAKLRERVVLYDQILQSIDSIKELQGAARDSEFMDELDAKRAYFQALK